MNFPRFFKSFKYALEGIHYTFRNDQNVIAHFIVGGLVIVASLLLKVNPFEMAILGLTIMMVISAEMVNSAIEKMVDLITKEHNASAKIAKDVSAGMVLLTALAAAVIGVLIFLPYILDLFR